MLRFLRKIRQQLLSEKKFSKYLAYALGEVILVVIGILLALQIDTWNNDRHLKLEEEKILTELRSGFLADKQMMYDRLAVYNRHYDNLLLLDSLLDIPDYLYQAELDTLFGCVYGVRYDRVNAAFYEDLKSSGLQLINDDQIRNEVVSLFENNYDLLKGIQHMETSINQVLRPYYLENFTDLDFQISATPNDPEKVWKDPYYKNIVHYRAISLQSNQLREFTNTITDIDNIVGLIDNYLKREQQ